MYCDPSHGVGPVNCRQGLREKRETGESVKKKQMMRLRGYDLYDRMTGQGVRICVPIINGAGRMFCLEFVDGVLGTGFVL